MAYDLGDTIAAIATANGGAARGMVRVSGPAAVEIVGSCFVSADAEPLVAARHPAVKSGRLLVPLSERPPYELLCDLFLWPTDRSYTREPVAELHTLGSPPLLRATLDAVCRAGARLAEPGEFTLRAFLAGRLDLTQAEAVLGVIDAHGADELHTAVEQLAGNLARPLQRLRQELLALLAEVEAGLDFVEDDIEFISAEQLVARLQNIAAEISAIAEQMASRLTAGATCQIVLIGPPNAGKSSLFNALAARFGTADGRAASAMVSDERGTTRDYLTATLDLDGILCELIDTAGIEDDPAAGIAASAQALAREQRERAVLRAYCVEAANSAESVVPPAELVIVTKCDLVPDAAQIGIWNCSPTVITSSVTGAGLDDLAAAIAALLSTPPAASRAGCVAATADRCRDSLRLADDAVARAAEIAAAGGGDELIAAEVRVALAELGRVVGAVYTDDLLDRIFSTFCIGK